MSLQELAEHFFRLYGRRNRLFLSSLTYRIDFLNLAIGDLQDAIRKDAGREAVSIALARLVSRVFCIAEHFSALPLVPTMVAKYPNHCSYCNQKPCACSEKRAEPSLSAEQGSEQLRWSLGDWCRHLNELYGFKNKVKGVESLLNRLFKEITELQSLSMTQNGYEASTTLDEVKREFALELSDALAWIISLANFLEIDLEKAVLDRFREGCWHCQNNPCECTYLSVQPVKWTTNKYAAL